MVRRRRWLLSNAARALAPLLLAALSLLGLAAGIYLLLRPEPELPFAYPYQASPNQDARPDGAGVRCVVIHATTIDTLDDTARLFLKPESRLSAHFIIGRDGRVLQMVPVERRAWHAGQSSFGGVPMVNDYSVGIELVNMNDGVDPFPEAQYQATAGVIRLLRSRYQIPDDCVVSHAAVAQPPGRKSDPLGFDFARLRALAAVP